ncbi:MAG: protein translocase subunit SecF [Myxococcota bacterium]
MFDLIDRAKNWLDALEIDFCRWRYIAMGISGALVVLTMIAFVAIGPNWGTDFTGGTEIHLKFDDHMEISDLRQGLRQLGLADDAVQAVNGSESGEFIIRIADPTFGMEGLEDELRKAFTEAYPKNPITTISGTAEVTARFVVDYEGDTLQYAEVGKQLQSTFPGASAAPGKSDQEVAISLPGLAERIQHRIEAQLGQHTFQVLSTDSVGPKVGAELRRNGFVSLAATLALILVYIAFRFDLEYAPGAILALFHDVTLTVGVFIVFQLDFNLPTVGALLTILGYSINDTIIIYDRIRENRSKFRRTDTITLINKSISETLTRTVATSGTTLMAIITFLIWGGPVLRDFAVAMTCGVVFGTYSTVYIASPLIIIFEDIKPHLTRLLAVRDDDDDESPFGGDDDGAPILTESEKRRRARADADKRETTG